MYSPYQEDGLDPSDIPVTEANNNERPGASVRSWGRRVLGRWYQRHRVLISLCKGAGGTQDEAREVEVGLGVVMTAVCEKAVCPQQKNQLMKGSS